MFSIIFGSSEAFWKSTVSFVRIFSFKFLPTSSYFYRTELAEATVVSGGFCPIYLRQEDFSRRNKHDPGRDFTVKQRAVCFSGTEATSRPLTLRCDVVIPNRKCKAQKESVDFRVHDCEGASAAGQLDRGAAEQWDRTGGGRYVA